MRKMDFLYSMDRECLTEKVTFQERLQGNEGAGNADILGKSNPARENSKGPEAKMGLMCQKNVLEEPRVVGVERSQSEVIEDRMQ